MKKYMLLLCVFLLLVLFGCKEAPNEQPVTTAALHITEPVQTTESATVDKTTVPPETTQPEFVPDYSMGLPNRFVIFTRLEEQDEWSIVFLREYGVDFLQYPAGSTYVFDIMDREIRFLCEETIAEIAETPNSVILSLKDGRVILADYFGTTYGVLYTSELGEIIHSNRYLIQMCIVEPGRIVLLNLETGAFEIVLEENDVRSAFMYKDDQLFWTKDHETYYILDTKTGTSQPISELDMNNLLNQRW